MKIKNSQYWQKLAEGLKGVFSKSLVECALFCLAAILLVICVLLNRVDAENALNYSQMLSDLAIWMIPFALLAYSANQWLKEKHRWIYYALIPAAVLVFSLVSVLYFRMMRTTFFEEIVYYGVLILSVMAVLASNGKCDNQSIFRDTCQIICAALTSVVMTLVIYLLCMAIMASVDYLFDVTIRYGYQIISIISWVAIAPIMFFAFDGTFSMDHLFQRKLIRNTFNYILSPAVVLYLLFLYAYIVKVLIIGQLPHGEITYIVSAFMAFAFICHLFDSSLSIPLVSKFYKYLHIMVLPPLVLAWLGAIKRISAYGFTEWRIFMLAMLILLSIYVLSLFFRNFKYHLSLALTVAALMCASLTLIKPINIKNLAVCSIQSRCEQMIATYALLDGDCVNVGKCKTMETADVDELMNLLYELGRRTTLPPPMQDLEDALDDVKYSNREEDSANRYFQNHYATFDIADYNKMTWVKSINNYNDYLEIEFPNDSTPSIKIKFSDVDAYIHSIVGEEIPSTLPAEAYVYHFDNKMVVFKHYDFENHHLVNGFIQDVVLE